MTRAMENYIELHRHWIVRVALLRHPACAFRLMVAHALAPAGNWRVEPDKQRARSKDIGESVAKSPAQALFNAEREAVADLIGKAGEGDTVKLFAYLLTLSDEAVTRIAAFAMAGTLSVGDTSVEAAGLHLRPIPSELWQPNETFFELIRERETVNAMLAEVAGDTVAKNNADEPLKGQKQIIRDCLAGENWRTKVEGWLPGWMQFPFKPMGRALAIWLGPPKQPPRRYIYKSIGGGLSAEIAGPS